jgi:hypothetical protein
MIEKENNSKHIFLKKAIMTIWKKKHFGRMKLEKEKKEEKVPNLI